MSFFFKRGLKGFPPNATFRLTQAGTDKLADFSGDPKSRILYALESGGTSNVQEISDRSGLTKGQVERILPNMIPSYVIYVNVGAGAGGMEDEI